MSFDSCAFFGLFFWLGFGYRWSYKWWKEIGEHDREKYREAKLPPSKSSKKRLYVDTLSYKDLRPCWKDPKQPEKNPELRL